MKNTLHLGFALTLGALVGGCGGGGGGGGDGGGGGGSWLIGHFGTVLSNQAGKYISRPSHTNADLLSIYCVDHQHGWISGAGGFFMRSTDGGATWIDADTGTASALDVTVFADVSLGFAAGDKGVIIRSEDGGQTWTAVSSGTTQTLRAGAFTRDHGNALLVGDGGTMLRSTDGGKTFVSVSAASNVSWQAVKLTSDGQLGFAAGSLGELRTTRDGGTTWSDLAKAPAGLHGLSVKYDGSRVIAVGDGGLVWLSNDQGVTWQKSDAGTTNQLNAVGFAEDSALEGWAVGNDSTILSTVDGAQTWKTLDSPVVADYTSIEDF